jgi:hypothetical protein
MTQTRGRKAFLPIFLRQEGVLFQAGRPYTLLIIRLKYHALA